jgi:hypothetical protein
LRELRARAFGGACAQGVDGGDGIGVRAEATAACAESSKASNAGCSAAGRVSTRLRKRANLAATTVRVSRRSATTRNCEKPPVVPRARTLPGATSSVMSRKLPPIGALNRRYDEPGRIHQRMRVHFHAHGAGEERPPLEGGSMVTSSGNSESGCESVPGRRDSSAGSLRFTSCACTPRLATLSPWHRRR